MRFRALSCRPPRPKSKKRTTFRCRPLRRRRRPIVRLVRVAESRCAVRGSGAARVVAPVPAPAARLISRRSVSSKSIPTSGRAAMCSRHGPRRLPRAPRRRLDRRLSAANAANAASGGSAAVAAVGVQAAADEITAAPKAASGASGASAVNVVGADGAAGVAAGAGDRVALNPSLPRSRTTAHVRSRVIHRSTQNLQRLHHLHQRPRYPRLRVANHSGRR